MVCYNVIFIVTMWEPTRNARMVQYKEIYIIIHINRTKKKPI